jgi:hypothetical protein
LPIAKLSTVDIRRQAKLPHRLRVSLLAVYHPRFDRRLSFRDYVAIRPYQPAVLNPDAHHVRPG